MWCCAKERKQRPRGLGRRTKLFLFSSSLLYMVWYIVDTGIAAHNLPSLSKGAKAAFCETSKLLEDTVIGERESGHEEVFMGIGKMEMAVQSLRESIEPEAQMFKQVTTSKETASVSLKSAVSAFVDQLQNLHTNLADPNTLMVGTYECVFCEVCCTITGNTAARKGRQHSDRGTGFETDNPTQTRLENAVVRIKKELTESLKEVDESIDDNFTGTKMQERRDSLKDGQVSLAKVRKHFDEDLIKTFVDSDEILNTIITYLDLVAVIILGVMVIPTLLLIGSLLWVFWKPRWGNANRPTPSVQPLLGTSDRRVDTSMPSPRKPCLVSTSWCVTFLFTFIIFLLGGLASIISYAESSVCEAAVHPDMFVSKISFRFDKADKKKNNDDDTLVKISESCIAKAGDGSFLDVIDLKLDSKGDDNENDEAENKEEIDEPDDDEDDESPNQIKRLEKRMFRDIDKMETDVDKKHKQFSKNKDVVDFLKYFADYGDMYLIKDSAETKDKLDQKATAAWAAFQASGNPMKRDTFYSLMESATSGLPTCESRRDVTLKGPVGRFVRTRFQELDHPIPPGTDKITFPGANEYYAGLERENLDIGVRNKADKCPAKFTTMNSVAGAVAGVGLSFFQELMTDKMQVITKKDFACNRMKPDGSIEVRKCNFEEWRQFLKETHALLTRLAAKVDEAQKKFSRDVASGVRVAMEESVVPRMDVLADGMSCNYIHRRYDRLVIELCGVHAPAMRTTAIAWVMFATVCWIAIMIEFWLWRYLVDYWTLKNDDDVFDEGDFHTPPENPNDNTLVMSGGETPPLRESRGVASGGSTPFVLY